MLETLRTSFLGRIQHRRGGGIVKIDAFGFGHDRGKNSLACGIELRICSLSLYRRCIQRKSYSIFSCAGENNIDRRIENPCQM